MQSAVKNPPSSTPEISDKASGTRQIPLTQGLFAAVDAADYEWLSNFKWSARRDGATFYAGRKSTVNGRQTTMLMHRLILGLTDPRIQCDHRDRNGLNNARENLRPASRSQNTCNQRKRSDNTSGYIGVKLNKASGKWFAQITRGGRLIHLGRYSTPEEAARARDAEAIKVYGEFAHLNAGKAVQS